MFLDWKHHRPNEKALDGFRAVLKSFCGLAAIVVGAGVSFLFIIDPAPAQEKSRQMPNSPAKLQSPGLDGAFGGGDSNRRAGALTRQEVMNVIRSNLTPLRHCYELELQRNANATGCPSLAFNIDNEGRVRDLKLSWPKGAVISDALQACYEAEIQLWRFPIPRGGHKLPVNFPMICDPL